MSSTTSETGSGSFREPNGSAPASGVDSWTDTTTIPVAEVRDLFVTLGKALRAVQLYDENNPVYLRFVQSLRDALKELWGDIDQLVVTIEEDRMTVGGEEAYRADNRSDSLAFLFFKDGIRKITLLPGIEQDELTRFLGVIQRTRRGRGEGDDLLTILWEADLVHFKYQYVDLLAEGVEIPAPGAGGSTEQLQGVLQEEAPAEPETAHGQAAPQAERPKGTVSRDDFNPTLYSLDPHEMEGLRKEVELEMARDLRSHVISALLDRLEEPDNPARQSEILAILRTLLPNLLSRGAILPAAHVLAELRGMEERTGLFDAQRTQKSEKILDRLSSAQTMDELVRSLEDGTIRSTPTELSALLRRLRPGALGPLLRASELTQIRELQPVLREAVHGIAEQNPQAVAALLGDQDPIVLAGAARLAGRLKTAEAAPTLAALMAHPVADVRLAAVEAAVDLKASTAAGALQPLLVDPERSVRIAAARGLGRLRYRPAAARFKDLVLGKEIRSADISEKIAFFESYGELAGEAALEPMDKLLNGKGFLGRKEPAEIRACAALALGKIGTDKARQSLQAASSEDDAVVRSAVNRALRGEESGARATRAPLNSRTSGAGCSPRSTGPSRHSNSIRSRTRPCSSRSTSCTT